MIMRMWGFAAKLAAGVLVVPATVLLSVIPAAAVRGDSETKPIPTVPQPDPARQGSDTQGVPSMPPNPPPSPAREGSDAKE